MSIKLPELHETHCQGIEACAFIEGEADAMLAALDKLESRGGLDESSNDLTAAYGAKASNRVILDLGVEDGTPYFHVNAFNPKRFDPFKGELAETAVETPLSKLQGVLDLLLGIEVGVELSAFFPLPLRVFENQCSLSSVFYNMNRDEITFRSRRMTLDFDEGPIDRLSWELLDDNESVLVRVDASLGSVADENFLTNLVKFSDEFFRAILMVEGPPERAKGRKPRPRRPGGPRAK